MEGSKEMVDDKGHNTLMLSDIRRSEAGEYECRATNGVGVPASHKIEIEVECKQTGNFSITIISLIESNDHF